MGVVVKKIAEFELPKPRTLSLDERTSAYIEKLKTDRAEEFDGPLDVKIDDFDGPLDLLLFMVKAARIDIEDIFVSKITEQYLALMQDLAETDLEKASEFIETAAILIEIKSKALLPKPEAEIPDENDAKRELIRRLEEYKLFKEAGEKMKLQETVGLFFRPPDPSVGDPQIILRDMTMEGMIGAMQKLFLKMEQRGFSAPPRKIVLDRFTVADKMGHIRDILLIREEVGFTELFESDYTKSEIITTFQALLELLKMQACLAAQDEIFGEIIIRRRAADDDNEN
ncbi:MAG: segregation/condensation protein A [Firmicutes bacterium]|nr:segregation/condensation protein A [Bacillota bacterium]